MCSTWVQLTLCLFTPCVPLCHFICFTPVFPSSSRIIHLGFSWFPVRFPFGLLQCFLILSLPGFCPYAKHGLKVFLPSLFSCTEKQREASMTVDSWGSTSTCRHMQGCRSCDCVGISNLLFWSMYMQQQRSAEVCLRCNVNSEGVVDIDSLLGQSHGWCHHSQQAEPITVNWGWIKNEKAIFLEMTLLCGSCRAVQHEHTTPVI